MRTPNVSVTTSVVTRLKVPGGGPATPEIPTVMGTGTGVPMITPNQRELHDQQFGQVHVLGVELPEIGDASSKLHPRGS